MSKLEAIRNLYKYNEWANNLVLEAAARLSEAQFSRPQGASFGSVEGSLAHTAGAQVVWLQRWTGGTNPKSLAQLQSLRGCEAIRDSFGQSHEALASFTSSLTEEELDRGLAYRDSQGNPYERVLWQLMLHVANHGTHHRAETALATTAMGSSPGDLDYGHFIDISPSDAPGALEMVRALYDYNEWANAHVLGQIKELRDEELLRPRSVSHSSLGMDLLHLLGGQVGWLSIFQHGAPRIALPSGPSGRLGDNLIDWYERSHDSLRGFVSSLTDEELGRPRIDNPDGGNRSVKQNRSLLLWDIMMHLVNHGTQHRAEAALALTELGKAPRQLDYLYFELERASAD